MSAVGAPCTYARTRFYRATGSERAIQRECEQARSLPHTRTRRNARTQRYRGEQRKSPTERQCGNGERLRVALCESRTTRAATNDLLISPSLRARSPRCTNFPERRNRTAAAKPSPDVLRNGLTLPLRPPFPPLPLPLPA